MSLGKRKYCFWANIVDKCIHLWNVFFTMGCLIYLYLHGLFSVLPVLFLDPLWLIFLLFLFPLDVPAFFEGPSLFWPSCISLHFLQFVCQVFHSLFYNFLMFRTFQHFGFFIFCLFKLLMESFYLYACTYQHKMIQV